MSKAATRPPARRAACVRVSTRLWPYLAGELTPSQGAALRRHLVTCGSCDRAARQLRGLLEACRAAGCGPLPRPIEDGASRRARAVLGLRPTARSRPRR